MDPSSLASMVTAMAMDPSLLVAVVSIATAAVTTSGGVAVAILTNRREAENAADDSRELTLRERLSLRDEQIAERDRAIANRDEMIRSRDAEIQRLNRELASARKDRE